MLIYVAFPVLKGVRRFVIEKGRRWSVIEHLLLDSVRISPRSASELAERSGLPRRVIVEAFIRLMRAGWVEIVAKQNVAKFQITPAGLTRVGEEQLPSATITETKWRGFAIEQVTGAVFRSRELDLRHENSLPSPTLSVPLVQIKEPPTFTLEDVSDVFTALENEDELIVGVERGTDKLSRRYALFGVRDNSIQGLPSRASNLLRQEIINAASKYIKGTEKTVIRTQRKNASVMEDIETRRLFLFETRDLIVGGSEHRKMFDELIDGAKERVVIHSTFINQKRIDEFLPRLISAAERGTRIDIMWGQDDAGSSPKESQIAALELRNRIEREGHSGQITIHGLSTNSHAKILLVDSDAGWRAVIGSCNWLSSDFESIDASVRLRDPRIVGILTKKMSRLALGRPGLWNDLSVDLAVLGGRILNERPEKGSMVPMQLLFGSEHARLALTARDKAKSRIFVTSHRIGVSGEAMTVMPALSAVKDKYLGAYFFYGKTTGKFEGLTEEDLSDRLGISGCASKLISRTKLHAKVLGWDDDNIAVTSMNWLSADPSESNPSGEIGVLVHAKDVAKNFITKSNLSLDN